MRLVRQSFGIAVACALLATSLHAQYRYNSGGGAINDATPGMPGIPAFTSFSSNVTNFVGQIVNVRVSVNVVHPAVQELSLTLFSPGNVVRVPLVENREDGMGIYHTGIGAAGADFGVGCRDTQRTTFMDGAVAQIPQSSAPYVGNFIPVYPYKLAALDGLGGNGTWTLEVVDVLNGNTGSLDCWSLFLDSTDLIFRDGFD